jgi:hypothetical protein
MIFFYISRYNKKDKKKSPKKEKENENEEKNKPRYNLIFKEIKNKKKVGYELLIICLLYTFIKVIRKIIAFFKVKELDFWIFHIVFIYIFTYKLFGKNIYKHQIYSLCFIFFTNIILLTIAATIPKNPDNNDKTIFEEHGWECALILLTYIIFSLISSFTKVATKKLMDINYVSLYKIIFFMGLFGSIFIFITLIFTSIISCNENSKYCKVKKYITDKNDKYLSYLDSLPIYLIELKDVFQNNDYKEFFLEIFVVTPLIICANFIEFTFDMLIILYLDPNYTLISDTIYFGTTKIIEYKIKGGYSFSKFSFDYLAEIFALVGYTIYLEIIELRFCGLNNDIKKNIIKRSESESSLKEIELNITNNSDDEDE